MENGFRVGNIVKISVDYYKTDYTFVVNKIVARNGKIVYGLLNQKDGSQCYWWNKEELEFISDGRPELVEELKEKRKQRMEDYKNLEWIKENWNPDDFELNLYSILTLFNELGYLSSAHYLDNKWIVVFSEWEYLQPIFSAIFKKDLKTAKSCVNNLLTFRHRARVKKNCKKLYKKLWKNKKIFF